MIGPTRQEIDRIAGVGYGGLYEHADEATRSQRRAIASITYVPPYTGSSSPGSVAAPHVRAIPGPPSAVAIFLGRVGRLVAILCIVPLVLVIAATAISIVTGYATAPDTSGVDTAAIHAGSIDAANYPVTDPEVQSLAGIPASRLYAQYLSEAPREFNRLNGSQRAAVGAAWQRYLLDPESFSRLENSSKLMSLFDGYLANIGFHTRDPQPLIDRGRLKMTPHGSIARARWSDGAVTLPDNPTLEALATENADGLGLGHRLSRGAFFWLRIFMDDDPAGMTV